ncbi:MAG: helix-turn-helix domain-containing protein [Bacteroidales bacterium]|nr:helix-turn-helix domain-containing protein [Bacteroidales bacterium]
MFTLKETWLQNYDELPSREWDGKMICMALNADMSFKANTTSGYSLHYSFTIVTRGWLTLSYGGKQYTIRPNDFYIYSPGFSINILDASSDYQSVCILIDEQTALEIPTIRHLVSIAYQPLVLMDGPIRTLPPAAAATLVARIREMIGYYTSTHIYKSQVLQLLFSVFILDVQNLVEHVSADLQPPQRVEELFVTFLRLLQKHFVERHDIAYYAEQMNISTVYLSRIVKQMTGRTVGEYVNQMLAMEATFLLTTTSDSISQIADRLHFADIASFSKFYLRMKGMTPKEYRRLSLSR